MNIIETQSLTQIFGANEALKNLNLSVPEGSTMAFLGPNGAGKTTTIKILVNILKATSGVAHILGTPSHMLQPEHYAKIGYVSENQETLGWMAIDEYLQFCRPFYPTWDQDFEKKLLKEFDLPPKQKIKSLSRGMQMKVSLLSSLAYRPRLLILDEPFSGLDPLVRDEFIRGILELSEQEGWSMLISSHDIDEVERLANRVSILHKGNLLVSESTEELQNRFREVELELPENAPLPAEFPKSWLCVDRSGSRFRFIDEHFNDGQFENRIHSTLTNVTISEARPMSLREIFVSLAKTYRLS